MGKHPGLKGGQTREGPPYEIRVIENVEQFEDEGAKGSSAKK